jgi:hypothetical protein
MEKSEMVNLVAQVRELWRETLNKIDCIRFIRETAGVGLKEAKDFYDYLDFNWPNKKIADGWCEVHWVENDHNHMCDRRRKVPAPKAAIKKKAAQQEWCQKIGEWLQKDPRNYAKLIEAVSKMVTR